MSTKARTGGTRRRRTQETTIDRALAIEPEPFAAPPAPEPAPETDALLLDDHSTAISDRPARLGRSLVGAVLGTMLVVGLAFGAALGSGGALGPTGERPADDEAAITANGAGHGGDTTDGDGHGGGDGHESGNGKDAGDGTDPGDGTDGKGGDWTDPESTPKPDGGDAGPTKDPGEGVNATEKPELPDPTEKPVAPEPTKKPQPESTPKPTEKPDPTREPSDPIGLELAIVEHHPKLMWGTCDGVDFDYYKVVRSKDDSVSWPAGDHDTVIAAVEAGGYRKAYDKDAPHEAKAWYRVFCVRKTDAGYKVVNASATKGIWVPEEPAPPPPPDPISLDIAFEVTEEGKVILTWSACEVDGFAFYKVVKSTWNDDPSYLPWTDGTEVIAAISDVHATEARDWAPESGETAYYRVQCIGYSGDHKVLLGESAVVTVTTP